MSHRERPALTRYLRTGGAGALMVGGPILLAALTVNLGCWALGIAVGSGPESLAFVGGGVLVVALCLTIALVAWSVDRVRWSLHTA